jgi:hypothetical protein
LNVKFGDGGTGDAECEGTIELKTASPEEPRLELKRVVYKHQIICCLSGKRNLLEPGQCLKTEKGL